MDAAAASLIYGSPISAVGEASDPESGAERGCIYFYQVQLLSPARAKIRPSLRIVISEIVTFLKKLYDEAHLL